MKTKLGCLQCGRGLCEFCGDCICCQSDSVTIATPPSESRKVGRPRKEDDNVTDKHSTGRKRAAVLFKLDRTKDCEWKNLVNCGGGKHPIIGCTSGKQQHRHHGPDKDTLKNEVGNVHRICDDCHNIWHSQNDNDYNPLLPHSPREATLRELSDRIMKIRYCIN